MEHNARKLVPIEGPGDPERCPSPGERGEGQCTFKKVPGAKHCPKHGGLNAEKRAAKERVHDYRLQIWQERVDEFAESDKIKTLRGEIGILRMTLEMMYNRWAHDQNEFILNSNRIMSMINQIERLITTCDKLETKFGMLLDKSAALNLANGFVQIIQKYIDQPEVIDKISGEMITLLGQVGLGEKNED